MLFRKSSNLFLLFSLICEVCNVHCKVLAIFNRSGLTANIEIKELNIMLGLYGGEDLDVIFNTVIFISKWEIWKIRNRRTFKILMLHRFIVVSYLAEMASSV
jgi:hypothetical protein